MKWVLETGYFPANMEQVNVKSHDYYKIQRLGCRSVTLFWGLQKLPKCQCQSFIAWNEALQYLNADIHIPGVSSTFPLSINSNIVSFS